MLQKERVLALRSRLNEVSLTYKEQILTKPHLKLTQIIHNRR